VAKQRRSPTEVEALTLVGDVEGHTAIMVDDLTTTGSTLCSSAAILKRHGAREVYAAVSHAPLTDAALERLGQSDIKEMVVTDSVPLSGAHGCPVTVLSVAELLGEAIRRIHENQSVTSLFRL
jgi:ribose-phosphate pyrophosphokinase